MKTAELRQKSQDELKDILAEHQKNAARFRFDAFRKKVKNVKELREIKKNIARVNTLLKEKSL